MANENGLWALSLPTSHARYGSVMSTAELWLDPRDSKSGMSSPENLGKSNLTISSGSNSHPFYIDKSAGYAYIDAETSVNTNDAAVVSSGNSIDIMIDLDMDDWSADADLLILNTTLPIVALQLVSNAMVLSIATESDGTQVFTSDPHAATGRTVLRARWVDASVDFFRSTDGGTTWIPIGTTQTGTGTRQSGSVYLQVGLSNFVGKLYKCSIGDGTTTTLEIDMLKANTDLSAFPLSVYPSFAGYTFLASWHFTYGTDPADPRYLDHSFSNYIYNASGDNSVTVPASQELDSIATANDVDIRCLLALDDISSDNVLVRWGGISDGFILNIRSNVLALDFWSAGGKVTTVGVPVSSLKTYDKSLLALHVTWDVQLGTFIYWFGSHTGGSRYDLNNYSWIEAGRDEGNSHPIPLPSTSPVEFVGNGWNGGKFIHSEILVDSTPSIDVKATNIQNGSDTSFDTAGVTATINRNSSFGTLSGVTRPVWNFINGSYLHVADSPDINYNVVDSFTLMAVCRYWDDPRTASLLEKRLGSGKGYSLKLNGLLQPVLTLSDGTNTVSVTGASANVAPGELIVVSAVVNRVANLATVYVNGVAAGQGDISSVGTLQNTDTLYIGSKPATANPQTYGDFELFGFATWRRALSSDDLKVISDGYTDTKFAPNDHEFGLWLVSVPSEIF